MAGVKLAVHECFHLSESLTYAGEASIIKHDGYVEVKSDDMAIGEKVIHCLAAGRLGEMYLEYQSIDRVLEAIKTLGMHEYFNSDIAEDDFTILRFCLTKEMLLEMAPGILLRGSSFLIAMGNEFIPNLADRMDEMRVGERMRFKAKRTKH